MNILVIHNYYRKSGGEDEVVNREVAILKMNNHMVYLYAVSNRQIDSYYRKCITLKNLRYSKYHYRRIKQTICNYNIGIVHVHNTFPLISSSVYDACNDTRVPVVQTLHNFRMICAAGSLSSIEGRCKSCMSGHFLPAVLGRCYRRSSFLTFLVIRMINYHKMNKTWLKKIDCYIAPSDFTRRIYVNAGFPHHKIIVKPHCVNDLQSVHSRKNRFSALFVGRLTEEKGIHTLLKAMEKITVPLRIVGDGPLRRVVENRCMSNIKYIGYLSNADVLREMLQALFVIIPSLSYETFGLVAIESFMAETPVISSKLGALEEIVEDGVTGIHFTPGDSKELAEKISWLYSNPSECIRMGENARRLYEMKYECKHNYEKLIELYSSIQNT